jgi:signal transduction histidine kinase
MTFWYVCDLLIGTRKVLNMILDKDLTRLESGNETMFNEPFDLPGSIEEAVRVYRGEAGRRQIEFVVNTGKAPKMVLGDAKKVRTVVSNLTANASKHEINHFLFVTTILSWLP